MNGQLRLGEHPAAAASEPTRPFITDDIIVSRLRTVEALLRQVIHDGQDRPFVEVGRAADALHRLARDLQPEVPS